MSDLDEYRSTRVEALRRGRTGWGHSGTHRGRFTQRQIEQGAPNCPQHSHHHHDDFCELPTPLECAEAGVTVPEGGWGRR